MNGLPLRAGWVSATASVSINHPVERVFEFVCNPKNDPLWNPKVVAVTMVTPGPLGVGSRFRQSAAFVGGRLESEWRITEFELNRLMDGESVRSMFRFVGGYRFKSMKHGTHVTKYASFDISAMLPPFVPEGLVSTLLTREFVSAFARLKRLLDQAG